MTEADSQWSDAVDGRIRAHLSAIDQALASRGVAFSQRRSIMDDVESQLREMVSARSATAPTLADVEAVLAELDPPALYAEQAGEGSPVAPPNANPPQMPTGTSQPEASAPLKPILKDLILTIVVHAALFIIMVMGITYIGPRVAVMLKELHAKPPPAALLAIYLTQFITHYGFFIAAFFVVLEMTCFLLFFFLRHERIKTVRKLWAYGVTLTMIAYFALWAVPIFITLWKLSHSHGVS